MTARAKKRHPLLSQEVLVAWRVQTTSLDQLNQVSDQVKSNFAISNLDISSNPVPNVVSLFVFQIIGSHFQTCEMITRCSPSCLEGLNNMLTFFFVCVCFLRPVSHPHLPKWICSIKILWAIDRCRSLDFPFNNLTTLFFGLTKLNKSNIKCTLNCPIRQRVDLSDRRINNYTIFISKLSILTTIK